MTLCIVVWKIGLEVLKLLSDPVEHCLVPEANLAPRARRPPIFREARAAHCNLDEQHLVFDKVADIQTDP